MLQKAQEQRLKNLLSAAQPHQNDEDIIAEVALPEAEENLKINSHWRTNF